MATPLTGEQIIERFELYTDDTTELSTDEELEVANDKLRLIYMEQPWEFLRRNKSGTVESDGKISTPTDFDEFMENYADDSDIPNMKVVYIGNGAPYIVIPMGQSNADSTAMSCWLDPCGQQDKLFAESWYRHSVSIRLQDKSRRHHC